jgi:deazaflavin-dependent oxidoreductase (nitroreductase family)
MGIVQTLDYRIPQPNALQRSTRLVASSRPGAWLFSRSMPRIDRVLMRSTGGRVALPTVTAGLPVMTVITRGAKTGLPRTTPLLGIPHGDDLAIIGTQFGQPGTPDWYFNLKADPSAEVIYRDKRVKVRASEADGDEWHAIWNRARGIYAGYDSYASRIHDRPIHILVLKESGTDDPTG